MKIRASILYVYLQCPHCVTMDRFAPPGEEEPVSAFVQLFPYPLTAAYHRFLRRKAKTAKAHKPIARVVNTGSSPYLSMNRPTMGVVIPAVPIPRK